MDEEIKRRLDAIEAKLDATFQAAEQSRKYLMWTTIVTVIFFVLPLVALTFVLPWFIGTYSASLGDPQNLQDVQSLLQGL